MSVMNGVSGINYGTNSLPLSKPEEKVKTGFGFTDLLCLHFCFLNSEQNPTKIDNKKINVISNEEHKQLQFLLKISNITINVDGTINIGENTYTELDALAVFSEKNIKNPSINDLKTMLKDEVKDKKFYFITNMEDLTEEEIEFFKNYLKERDVNFVIKLRNDDKENFKNSCEKAGYKLIVRFGTENNQEFFYCWFDKRVK